MSRAWRRRGWRRRRYHRSHGCIGRLNYELLTFFNARLGCGLQMSLGHNRDTQGLSPNKLLEKDSLCLGRIVGGSAGGTMIEAQSRPKAEIQPEMQK